MATKGKPVTAKDHQRSIADDYGQWVAVEDIQHDGALAYAVGHPVPHTNVLLHGYDERGQVAKVDTKAAAAPDADPAATEGK